MTCLSKHQIDAVKRLRPGSILCGGVGSGKSRTALAYFLSKIHSKELYIITTARKRDTHEWEEECAIFSMEDVNVHVDSWNNIKKYEAVTKAFFIFDEQRVVGSGSWVKSYLKIAKNNQWILLSATPGDTWMDYIPVFVANGFYKNRSEFIRRHVVFSRFAKYPKVEKYLETDRLEKIRKHLLVNMFLDRAVEHYTDYIFAEYDKSLYLRAIRDRWDVYKDQPIQDAGQLCYILRRIVNSDKSRLDVIRGTLVDHPKLIIFYNFDYELDLLRDLCETDHISYSEWNGHKHDSIPKTDSWLYLVQYTAGAEGWNCIETDTIIFYSQNYSYKIEIQAAGRIDRLNTPYSDLYYYHIVSSSTIDSAITKALKAKRYFNEAGFLA